jgi:predicted amidohydrolase YtcJ
MFAAVHRRYPHEAGDWHPAEAIDVVRALSAYTLGPARSFGRGDEGHLRAGAVADLVVLDVDLPTLLAADERLTDARSELTLVGGREAHRS